MNNLLNTLKDELIYYENLFETTTSFDQQRYLDGIIDHIRSMIELMEAAK